MITVYEHCYSDVFQSVEIVDEVPSTDQGAIRGLHLGSVTSQGLMEEEERDVIVIPSGTEPSQMGEMCIFKGELSDSFTNYNYVGNTKVSVSIKKTYANKCTLSELFLTEILKSFSVF